MKRLISIAFLLLAAVAAFAGGGRKDPARHVLENAWSKVDKSVIQPGGNCFPYPEYSDRAGWDEFFGSHKKAAIKNGEKFLNYEWKVVKATDYIEIERSGNRSIMQKPNDANRKALIGLIFAELAEGQGRFIDQIINGVWLQTERTSWIMSAHQSYQKSHRGLPDSRDLFIDLGVQRIGFIIAVAVHFFEEEFNKVDPSIAVAARAALNRNVFEPFLDVEMEREQSWMGFRLKENGSVNNWNPWCNSMVLYCFLLVEKDRDRLLKAFDRSIRSTDVYMDTNKMDGGCDEGPGYWGRAAASLYDYLRIANDATKGQLGCWDDPQVRAMSNYKSRVLLGDGWTANFGDGSSRAAAGSPDLVYRYGKDCGYKEVSDFAIYVNSFSRTFGKFTIPFDDVYRDFEALRYEKQFAADCKAALDAAGGDMVKMRADLRRDVPAVTWYEETAHLMMNNSNGWNLAAKGGHNQESHNHNDVGTCILVVDGFPVLVDAGVGTYTKQTFSKDRYKIWTMQSCWHNLPTINGIDQKNGLEYRASSAAVDSRKLNFKVGIESAYPEESACKSWLRTYQLGRESLQITDKFSLLKRNAADIENFLVYGSVYLPGDTFGGKKVKSGEVVISVKSFDRKSEAAFTMSYPSSLTPSLEEKEVGSSNLSKNWGKTLRRLRFTSKEDAPVSGTYSFKISKL